MRTVSLVLAVAIVAACASTQRGQYAQIMTTYREVGEQLIDLRRHGFISDEEWGRIKAVDRAFWAAIGAYKEGVGTLGAVRAALTTLQDIQQKAKVSDGPPD